MRTFLSNLKDKILDLVEMVVRFLLHPIIFSVVVMVVAAQFFGIELSAIVALLLYLAILQTQILVQLIEIHNQVVVNSRNQVKTYSLMGKMVSALNNIKLRERKK